MFDNLRKSGSSMVIWVLFGILIAGFVISFGPQSVGSGQGCQSTGRTTMLTVGDKAVDDAAWRFAWGLARGDEAARGRERSTLNALVRRELLAQEAERRGLRVGDDLIDYTIMHGQFRYAGGKQDARRAFFDDDGKGVFSYKLFKLFTSGRFNMSVAQYKRQQAREILAATMADILAGSVTVSREEALARYIAENTTVAYELVRFTPASYARALIITDADRDRFLASHEAEVKATYSDTAWKGKQQVRVGRIYLARTPPPATGAAPAVDPAKGKLEVERAAIVAGKKTFAAAATALDADPVFRGTGGDWGWYDEAAMTLPDPALNSAVKALAKAGEVSPVIEAADGFYLVTVVDKRQGDLTFDQVKRDLADQVARPKWGQEAARRAAAAALAKAQAEAKPLAELFPGTKLGATWTETTDVPAAWMQAGSGSAPTPTPAAGDPPAAPVAPVAPVATAIGPDEPLPASTPVEVSATTLPPLPRSGNRTPFGESAKLTKAVYEELTPGAVGPEVYEFASRLGGEASYAIVRMTAKSLPDVANFEKEAGKFVAQLAAERGQTYLRDWLTHRCKTLVASNKIRARTELLINVDDQGARTQVAWDPCSAL